MYWYKITYCDNDGSNSGFFTINGTLDQALQEAGKYAEEYGKEVTSITNLTLHKKLDTIVEDIMNLTDEMHRRFTTMVESCKEDNSNDFVSGYFHGKKDMYDRIYNQLWQILVKHFRENMPGHKSS